MPTIKPFAAIRYARDPKIEFANVIAPPYDVLTPAHKAALQAMHPNNIATVDWPHPVQKQVGPVNVYEQAAKTLAAWRSEGALVQDARPAIYPYTQTYEHNERTFRRRGFFALVKLSPFGAGDVVPHEKTYREAIEDRLMLMHKTQMQLSPIFGLFSDPKNDVANLMYRDLGRPEQSGVLDDVQHDLWSLYDAEIQAKAIDHLAANPIYIADGHHRYTTALEYKRQIEEKNGAPLPPNHPANYCLFFLIGMQDPGLLILPTHRLIGGLNHFDIGEFKAAVEPYILVNEMQLSAEDLISFANDRLLKSPPHTFGLFDGKTRKLYSMSVNEENLLAGMEPDHSNAWRKLDVAILQRFMLDEVIRPLFASGNEPVKGYTPDPAAVAPQVDGEKYQIAILLQPTPLIALEELSKHNEVMPQKSTYFYPKLATGMVMNSLEG